MDIDYVALCKANGLTKLAGHLEALRKAREGCGRQFWSFQKRRKIVICGTQRHRCGDCKKALEQAVEALVYREAV